VIAYACKYRQPTEGQAPVNGQTNSLDLKPRFPQVDEDDEYALLAERSHLINALATVEEALREKHGASCMTV
jgi:hypothetical protein